MGKLIDLTGQRFGYWIVIEKAHLKYGHMHWKCKCECGTEKIVSGSGLRTGHSKSCGCLSGELASVRNKTHGMSASRVYNIYYKMLDRCYNENHVFYENYGKRGIGVCDRWLESFENFYADMLDPPTGEHSLERLDNSEGYSPSNCIWALPDAQCNNRRSTHFIEYRGLKQSISQWARWVGLKVVTLQKRIEANWRIEDALFRPVDKSKRRKQNGIKHAA